jgi:uracil-DNA glycosylase
MSSKAKGCRSFDPHCRDCARLASYLEHVREIHPSYHAAPVASFGDRKARLLVVGLAPGLHGANRTGRPFTGDFAGILLYRMLHRFGFATRPLSEGAGDGLALIDCRITNAVRCLPPKNRPEPIEVRRCNRFLAAELSDLARDSAVLALGSIAHRAVLMALRVPVGSAAFAHGARHVFDRHALVMFDSYHCSRYNTQTKRLTEAMFASVFEAIERHLRPAGRTTIGARRTAAARRP